MSISWRIQGRSVPVGGKVKRWRKFHIETLAQAMETNLLWFLNILDNWIFSLQKSVLL